MTEMQRIGKAGKVDRVRKHPRELSLLAVAPLMSLLCAVLTASAQPPPPPTFTASTAAVVVDVVRDGRHRPVTGLTVEDFEVYEDGVRQTITSFEAIGEREPDTANGSERGGPAEAPMADKAGVPSVVALVFEQLSPEGRRIAQRAATAFVTDTIKPSDYAGVFFLDRALHVLVSYTADARSLQEGIREAFLRPGYPLERAGAVPGAEYDSSEPGQASRSAQDDSPFVRAHATFDGLERLIESLAALPGRKTVVLFSEGMALMQAQDKSVLGESLVPGRPMGASASSPAWHDKESWVYDNRRDHFLQLFERANRAHVAFYTFDARGLRIESPLVDKNCPSCAPYVGLRMLADETGGVFVENTNDLTEPLGRVGEDLRHYYLVSYNSTNEALDDTYREIRVKVRRKGLTVLARRGYRASRVPDAPPLRMYEIGPVLALQDPRVPNAFQFHAGSLWFPARGDRQRAAIVAIVPTDSLRWTGNQGQQQARVTVVARIRDAQMRVVNYGSERFEVTRTADPPASTDVLFHKETDLLPGVYTIEVVAYDEMSSRASVRVSTLEVPRPIESGPRLGSVFLVRSSVPLTAAAGGSGALQFGNWRLVPNVDRVMRAGRQLAFAFSADVTRKAATHLSARATLLKEGDSVAAAPIELAPPDPTGRITYVGRIQPGPMTPGTYQLVVTVADGTV